MLTRRHALVSTLALGLAAGLPANAAAPRRDNPMPEALRRDLERDPTAPVLGNPDGDITLTEFFDYNCQHCRKMPAVIQKLIAADPRLRIVYREWPIFGEGSEFAARASLASLQQGKYWALHTGLMAERGRIAEAAVLRVARQAGLDVDRLRKDMEAPQVARHIDLSQRLADHMGIDGTPSFVAGDEAAFGAMSLGDLRALVARARETLGVAAT